MNSLIRQCTPQEAYPFLASKWLHIQFLIDSEEMKLLLQALHPVFLFSTMGIQQAGKNALSIEHFLERYSDYIELLKGATRPQDQDFRFYFTLIMAATLDGVQALLVGENREIIRPFLPVLQMQLHRFDYSKVDGKIRPMVLGKDTISWGVQISYPQLFQDHVTRKVHAANNAALFPNAALFRKLQLWIRAHTLPTAFLAKGVRINSPIRIGKECLHWIECHPELKERGLTIYNYGR